VPSLTIKEEEIEEGMQILEEAMRVVLTPGEHPSGKQVSGEVDSPN
jgi:acetylornithine aminotransferase